MNKQIQNVQLWELYTNPRLRLSGIAKKFGLTVGQLIKRLDQYEYNLATGKMKIGDEFVKCGRTYRVIASKDIIQLKCGLCGVRQTRTK